jgi:hypothetical protein
MKDIPSSQMRRALRKAFGRMPETHAPSGFIFGADAVEVAQREFAPDRQFLKDEFGIELVPPRLDSQVNGLRIDADEFADIVAVAEDFGVDGQAIVQFASRFVR